MSEVVHLLHTDLFTIIPPGEVIQENKKIFFICDPIVGIDFFMKLIIFPNVDIHIENIFESGAFPGKCCLKGLLIATKRYLSKNGSSF